MAAGAVERPERLATGAVEGPGGLATLPAELPAAERVPGRGRRGPPAAGAAVPARPRWRARAGAGAPRGHDRAAAWRLSAGAAGWRPRAAAAARPGPRRAGCAGAPGRP